MPKNIQIRAVPDDVHRSLATRAAAAGTSLSDYLRNELERMASRPPVADVLRRAAERHGGTSGRAIVDAVRRERDTGGGRRP